MDSAAVLPLASTDDRVFLCPGEFRPIDRGLHTARLAAGYSACRNCEHRGDGADAAQQRTEPKSFWTTESFAGVCQNEITPAMVRQLAGAFASAVFESSRHGDRPNVVLAGDGRLMTFELVAAAGEGLRWAGCNVIEIGSAAAGMIGLAQFHLKADAALLIGNEPSEPQTVSVKFWADGKPWSLGGSLERVRRNFERGCSRPMRSAGAFSRSSIIDAYRESLAGMFHALRPLRFVLDTRCSLLERSLREFLSASGCRVLPPKPLSPEETRSKNKSVHDSRARMVAAQVVSEEADFGIWIDGDGEAIRLFDEHGRPIELADMAASFPGSAWERTAPEALPREHFHDWLTRNNHPITADAAGRLWFRSADGTPQCDALLSLAALLNLLSQSDRPLSRIIAKSSEA